MNIGLCGVEKSGNYYLYRILRQILEQTGRYSSFSEYYKIWHALDLTSSVAKTFPEITDLDEVRFDADGVLLVNSHHKASARLFDIDDFDRRAKLIWCHQPPDQHFFSNLKSDRVWFYIVRDGKAVVNSWIHYATSARMLARHPSYRVTDPKELYADLSYFKNSVHRWTDHVASYLGLRDQFVLIEYNKLLEDSRSEIHRMITHLGVSENGIDLEAIIDATSFQSIRKHAPNHARKAKKNDYRSFFTEQHHEIYCEITADITGTLKEVGVKF